MAIERENELIDLEIAPDSAQEISTPMMNGDALMLDDGSAIVHPAEDTSMEGAFNANLAEFIPDDELEALASDLVSDYEYDKDAILVNSPSNIVNQKIKIFSNINLDPFYLDAKILMIEKNYKFLIK